MYRSLDKKYFLPIMALDERDWSRLFSLQRRLGLTTGDLNRTYTTLKWRVNNEISSFTGSYPH